MKRDAADLHGEDQFVNRSPFSPDLWVGKLCGGT